MKLIGVTGGICTGSHTLIEYIEKKGFPVIKKEEIFHYLQGIKELSKYNLQTELLNKDNSIKAEIRPHFLQSLQNREAFFRITCKAVVFVELPFYTSALLRSTLLRLS